MSVTARDVAVPLGAQIVESPHDLVEFFSDVPAAHVYEIADADEPYWSGSRWLRRGNAMVGLVGRSDVGLITMCAVSTRDVPATLALAAEVAADLPAGLMLTGPVGLTGAIAERRGSDGVVDLGHHEKYELVDREAVRLATSASVVELGPQDASEVLELYAVEPGSTFFDPAMLDDASFVAVRDDGDLVAVAGTHVVSERFGVAAVGAVFVHPKRRGEGLGRVVTVGAVNRLAGRVATIGLNVDHANVAARSIYESVGFRPVLTYEETDLV